MSWAPLILAIIRIAVAIQTWVNQRQLLQAGQDRAVANAALDLLEQTRIGKELREKVSALTDTEAEALWTRMREQS